MTSTKAPRASSPATIWGGQVPLETSNRFASVAISSERDDSAPFRLYPSWVGATRAREHAKMLSAARGLLYPTSRALPQKAKRGTDQDPFPSKVTSPRPA